MKIPVVLAVAFVVVVTSVTSDAQDRYSKFQQRLEKRWDDVRPRGKLIKQIRDSLNLDDDEGAEDRPSGTPTLAEPRGQQAAPDAATERGLRSGYNWPRQSNRRGDDRSTRERANDSSEPSPRLPSPTLPSLNAASAYGQRNARGADSTRRTKERTPAQPAPETSVNANQGGAARLGVVLDTRSKTDEGLRIDRVTRKSPAAEAGLRNGDVLLSIAGVPLNDPLMLDQLLDAFTPQDYVEIEYQRGKKTEQGVLNFGNGPGLSAPVEIGIGDDSLEVPLPPPLPNGGAMAGPGLQSVLDPAPQQQSNRRSTIQNPYYPSPNLLPPTTGSGQRQPAVGDPNPTQAPRHDERLFRSLLPQPPAGGESSADIPEIELLSPDGR